VRRAKLSALWHLLQVKTRQNGIRAHFRKL
jgi:hypothetical protein